MQNPDEQILIPLQTARYRVFGTDRLRLDHGPGARRTCRWSRGWWTSSGCCAGSTRSGPGGDNDFQIRNQQDILATQQQTTQIFTTLLASIAAVSLLVGGIGIMNIMLVSVTERTREIGVRKALGATRLNILLQFLIEALVLCLVGGMLGILLGVGRAMALSKLLQWNTLISPTAVAVAFVFSAPSGSSSGSGRPAGPRSSIRSRRCGTSKRRSPFPPKDSLAPGRASRSQGRSVAFLVGAGAKLAPLCFPVPPPSSSVSRACTPL